MSYWTSLRMRAGVALSAIVKLGARQLCLFSSMMFALVMQGYTKILLVYGAPENTQNKP